MASYSANGATPGAHIAGSSENGGARGAPEYTLSGVLHFLQSEWRRYEHERNVWSIERAELRARIALLEGERRSVENLKTDLLRRIKMLEFALKQERIKGAQNTSGLSALPLNVRTPIERSANGSGNQSPLFDDANDLNHKHMVVQSNQAKLPMGVKDAKGRAKSRAYLQQCLQEIAYLTSNVTLNPIANQANASDASDGVPQHSRPQFLVSDNKELSTKVIDNTNITGSTITHGAGHVCNTSQSNFNEKEQPFSTISNDSRSEANIIAPAPNAVQPFDATNTSVAQKLAGVPDVQLWNSRGTIQAHFDAVRSLAYDLSGFGLFTASDDCTIKFWRLPSLESSPEAQDSAEQLTTLRGHEAAVTCLVHSKHLNTLFSGSLDGSVRKWGILHSTPMKHDAVLDSIQSSVFAENVQAVLDMALFPFNGKEDALLAIVSADGTLKLCWTDDSQSSGFFLGWNYFGTESNAEIESMHLSHMPVPTAVAKCAADLKACAVSFSNGDIKMFELASGRELRQFKPPSPSKANALITHPTLPLVASAHDNQYIYVYDINTGLCVLSLHAHDSGVMCMDIDPSGLTIVSGSRDNKVRFWDLMKSNECGTGQENEQAYKAMCFQEISFQPEKSDDNVLTALYHPTRPFVATAGVDGIVHMFG